MSRRAFHVFLILFPVLLGAGIAQDISYGGHSSYPTNSPPTGGLDSSVGTKGILQLSTKPQVGSAQTASSQTTLNPQNSRMFDYLAVIVMENKDYSQVIGDTAAAPYENYLASRYGLPMNYHSASGIGSLPNYLAMVSGQTLTTKNCEPSCAGMFNVANIVDLLQRAGITWQAYAENYPITQGCYNGPDTSLFVNRHFPFLYFTDIVNSSSRCSRLLNSGGGPSSGNDTAYLRVMNAGSGWPNFLWLTPNECDNTHDCSVSAGDTFLSQLVPNVLNSTLFRTQKAALFVVWDEGNSGSLIPAIWAGSAVLLHHNSTKYYDHYSLTKTIENGWGLIALTTNDAGASTMTEFFTGPQSRPIDIGSSWNPEVSCNAPWIVKTSDITANATGQTSLSNSPYSPGIVAPNGSGFNASNVKRWLTTGNSSLQPPPGWLPTGPPCTITNSNGPVASFVEIDNVRIDALFYTESDCDTKFDPINGGTAYSTGTQCDRTTNIYSGPSSACSTSSDPSCWNKIHVEIDHDWQGAGYCGPSTVCDPALANSQIMPLSTLIDVQGFVYWDPEHVGEQWHSFSGWELHPLTAWRFHGVSLTPSPSNLGPLNANVTASSQITVSSFHNFTGTVALTTSIGPFGASCSPSVFVTAGGNMTTICSFGAPQAGNYTIVVNGYSGITLVATTTVQLVVVDFNLSSSLAIVNANAGATSSSIISVSPMNGFASAVALSVISSSTNLVCSLAPMNIPGGAGSSTLSCHGSAVGNYLATVNGTSGNLSHPSIVAFHIQDFTIALTPTSITANAGAASISTATVAPLNGFTGTVNLAVATNSTSLLCVTTPSSITGGSGKSNLSCTGASAGNYLATVTGTNGSLAHPTAVVYHIQDFTLTGGSISLNANVGAVVNSTMSVAPRNGFAGTVTLAVTTNSTSLKCTLTSTSVVGGSGTSTLSCSANSVGNYASTVTGTNSSLSHLATSVYHVQDYTVSATQTNVNANVGATATSQIVVAPVNGFTGAVNLAVTVNSTSLICALNPVSVIGGSGSSALSCHASPIGNYLATVTGKNASLIHSIGVVFHVQDFAVSSSPSTATTYAGLGGNSNVTITPANGFTGIVTLAVSTNSTNLSCTLTATSVKGSGNSTLSCAGSAAGNYLATVTGTNATLSHSSMVTYHVQDFTTATVPAVITLNAGARGNSTITLSALNGFSGTVTLTATTNSTNLSCILTITSIPSGSGTSTLSCTGSMAGNYLVTVTGRSAGLSHSPTVVYHVQDYTVTGSPSSANANVGASATSTIAVSALNGFTGTVKLATTTNSTSLSCTLSATSLTGGSGTSTLSCTGSAIGNYLATVNGTNGTLSHSTSVTYHVQDFTITANPSSITLNAGAAGQSTIAVAPLNGFTGTLTVKATTNSTSLTCTLTAASIAGGSGASTLSCTGSIAGNYLSTITATNGTLSHPTAVTYHVQDFVISASPTTVTVTAAIAGTSTITVSSVNGFSGTVSLAVITNSTNLACSLSSTNIPGGSGNSILSCTGSVGGNYQATVTGTSGGLSHSAIVVYRIQDYSVAASPTSANANVATTTNSTITVSSINGFAGTVTLVPTTNSTSLSCSLTPTLISGGAGTSILSCSGSPVGNYLAKVNGTSPGAPFHSATFTVHVQDFTITASPTSANVNSGVVGTSTMTVVPQNGFTASVALVVTTNSTNLLCTFSSTNIAGGSGTSTLSCHGSPAGNYNATVTGNSGTLSHSASVVLHIQSLTVSVVRGLDGSLYWNALSPGGSWSGWQSLAGSTASAPVLCSTEPGTVDLVVRGLDNSSIWLNTYSNGLWSGWNTPGGSTNAQPTCAFLGGLLRLTVRGLDNGIWYNSYNDTSRAWTGWVSLGGYATGSPVLTASSSANRLDLLVQGGGDSIWHRSFLNGIWSNTWDTPGGNTPSTPAAVSDGNTLYLVVRGESNGLWYDSLGFTSGSWSGWQSISGSTLMAPTLAIDSSGTVHLVVVGLDNGIYHKSKPFGGSWSSAWDSPLGSTLETPAIVTASSSLQIVVTGVNGTPYSNNLQRSSWLGWTSMGGTTNNPLAITFIL